MNFCYFNWYGEFKSYIKKIPETPPPPIQPRERKCETIRYCRVKLFHDYHACICVFFDQFCNVRIKNYKELRNPPSPPYSASLYRIFLLDFKWHKNHWPNRINQLVPVTTSYDGESLDHPEVSHRRSQISNFLMISLMLTGGGKKNQYQGPRVTQVLLRSPLCVYKYIGEDEPTEQFDVSIRHPPPHLRANNLNRSGVEMLYTDSWSARARVCLCTPNVMISKWRWYLSNASNGQQPAILCGYSLKYTRLHVNFSLSSAGLWRRNPLV